MASPAQAVAPTPELRFNEAEFVVSDDTTPPRGGWRPQALPDSWLHDHPGLSGIGWYRIRFALDTAPQEPMALLVGRVATTGQFWLNGLVLNPDVRFDGPLGVGMGRWPHLITLPSGVLRAGENVLHIRVHAMSVGGRGLGDVRIGPMDRLRTPWLVREIPQRTIPQALFVLLAAGSVIGLLAWLRERRVPNLHFAFAMILWTAIVGGWVLPEPPLAPTLLGIYFATLYITFYWTLLHLFYRYSGSDWHWYPRVLNGIFGLTMLATAALIVFNRESSHAAEQLGLALLPTVFLRVLATVMLLQSAWRRRSPRAYALAATEVLWFAGHLQIIAIMAGWLPPDPFRLDPASSLPLYFVLLYFFVDRLVREREEAIRKQHAALGAERARILQDMHDGMGSQLVMALRVVKRDDGDRAVVARSIEEALQDMRLIIDSLDATEQGLVPKLANLRYRLEPRLASLGIRLNWAVQPVAELERLSPQAALGVLRIVQEALNNAIKHARPAAIAVSVSERDGGAVIRVADDGTGFDPDTTLGRGRGLTSMRKRAEQLGASCRIERDHGGGTAVTLHLPLSAAGARAEVA
jgi:signal transduction histidine kinase